MPQSEYVKIHITFDPRCYGMPGSETMWAEPLGDDLFKVNNVPFFAYGISNGDVVRCKEREVIEVVRPSGNRTLRVKFNNTLTQEQMQAIYEAIVGLGGEVEPGFPGLISINVPPAVDYDTLVSFLEGSDHADMLAFETGDERVVGRFDDFTTGMLN